MCNYQGFTNTIFDIQNNQPFWSENRDFLLRGLNGFIIGLLEGDVKVRRRGNFSKRL